MDKKIGPTWKSTERLYLNEHGEAVKADDPGRVTLLVGAGGQMPYAQAVRLGLVATGPTIETPAEPEAETPAEPTIETPVREVETGAETPSDGSSETPSDGSSETPSDGSST